MSCEPQQQLDPGTCLAYEEVLSCCLGKEPSGEVDPAILCGMSFEKLFSGDDAPEACAELMPPALACAVGLAEQDCSQLGLYYEGLQSGVSENTIGPPQDPDMPCREEVVALWDAGCEPYLF